MRVIGVGFGRTGTASLKAALERLGQGPCYHMLDVVQQPMRARAWLDAADGHPDWNAIFDGFRSTVDWPGAAFWQELVEVYPDAKVILTVRDPQRWYDSADSTIFRAWRGTHSPGAGAGAMLRLTSMFKPGMSDFVEMTRRVVSDRVFNGQVADRAYAVGAFEQHRVDVEKMVPAERLLVFDVAEGWQPLCEFLGVEVPDEPFPRLNDAAEFNRRRAQALRRRVIPAVAVVGAAIAAVAAATAWALRARRH